MSTTFHITGNLREDAALFKKLGVKTASEIQKRRRLMIGTDGLTNTGKTEFMLSAPGPKVIMVMDRGFDSALDNPHPPASRDLSSTAFDIIPIPNLAGGMAGSGDSGKMTQTDFVNYWNKYRSRLYELLDVPELVTLGIDGDSDTWELQVMADFGKTTQIHPMQYQMTYAARRAMINRCWQSGKIIIASSKLKDKYEDILDDKGVPIKESSGRNKQQKVTGEYKRQGFPDQDYLWQLQLRHLARKTGGAVNTEGMTLAQRLKAQKSAQPAHMEWGLRIMKCKANPMLEGEELWGDKCNLRSLVEYVYPNVDPTVWGFQS